jgi:hypothetical protein
MVNSRLRRPIQSWEGQGAARVLAGRQVEQVAPRVVVVGPLLLVLGRRDERRRQEPADAGPVVEGGELRHVARRGDRDVDRHEPLVAHQVVERGLMVRAALPG